MSQIACKLSPEPKAGVTNMRSEAFFIFSRARKEVFTAVARAARKTNSVPSNTAGWHDIRVYNCDWSFG